MQMTMCQAVNVRSERGTISTHMVSVADVKYPDDSSDLTETKTETSPQGDSRSMDITSVA